MTLAQGNLHMKIKTGFSRKAVDHFQPFSFCIQAFQCEENKIKLHDVGHMTKMAAMPIYVMNLSKYSPEPLDLFARNFVKH